MENTVNYKRVKEALENGIRIVDLSPFGQFLIQCLGYRFYSGDTEVFKFELFESGYTDVTMLLNGEYPFTVKKR